MATSRRAFLKSGTIATVFAGLYVGGSGIVMGQAAADQTANSKAKPNAGTQTAPGFEYKAATFEPHLDSDFRVRAGVKVTTLRLVKVKSTEPRSQEGKPTPRGENFSLLFHADGELSSVQTIYTFEHPALGKFPLFVSRAMNEADKEGIYYEAVINRAM